MNALVLLSGGMDSATALAIAQREGFEVSALSFDYGQRHFVELEAAQRVARRAQVKDHVVMKVDLRSIGGSALTGHLQVPKYRLIQDPQIPVTYVPARNIVFLSLALGMAETREISDLFIGVNALDYSGYPDCRPEFIQAFEAMANVGTKSGVTGRPFHVHTPLMQMTKSEIIKTGLALGVDYGLTMSCYDPGPTGDACGGCDACQLRQKGFQEAGIEDPTLEKVHG